MKVETGLPLNSLGLDRDMRIPTLVTGTIRYFVVFLWFGNDKVFHWVFASCSAVLCVEFLLNYKEGNII